MLHDQNLLKFLLGEATNTTVYVQNKTPHQALGDKTLEEVFTGIKPNVDHLRILGYPVYFHVLKYNRNKLETNGNKYKFVGYCENFKTFRIYVHGQRSIEFSRDVTFDEDSSLGKERDIPPPPPVEKKDDDMDLLEGPSMTET